MDIRETRDGTGITITIDRSLDLTSAGDLDKALSQLFEEGEEPVFIDIAAVQSIDSAGLTVFLKWHRTALAGSRRFALVRAKDFHRKLLEITRLDEELVLLDHPGGSRERPKRRGGPYGERSLSQELERVL